MMARRLKSISLYKETIDVVEKCKANMPFSQFAEAALINACSKVANERMPELKDEIQRLSERLKEKSQEDFDKEEKRLKLRRLILKGYNHE